jgi:uncharacterized damage-inducible protein DinB
MVSPHDQALLEALLDSWNRNNTILLNLLHAVPNDQLEARVMKDSPSIAEMFAYIHYVRLVFISEDAPEFARELPGKQWLVERDLTRLAQVLQESAQAVREAVKGRIETGRQMDLHYDHPVLFLQHMIWHEGYHHGQIKLALKAAGYGLSNKDLGPLTWRVWMNKS